MSGYSNCTCVVARGGTYLVDGEWTINPNVWVDVNGGLISDGHNRIVSPAGAGEQLFLNKTNHCWGSKGTQATCVAINYGRDAWVRAYVAAKADMSRWLAVEAASSESDESGGLRCINLRVLDTGDELFAWRAPWGAIAYGVFPQVAAAYDHEAHRLYFSWTGGSSWMPLDPPDDPTVFGRFAGFGCYGNADEAVVFDRPRVSMFGNAVAEGCTKDCGTIEHDNFCDPLTSGMQPLYASPSVGTDCDQVVGWQTSYLGASDPWALSDTTAIYAPAGDSCGGTAQRRIRVFDCNNRITIGLRTGDRDSSDDEPLASVGVYRNPWQGPGTAGYVEIFDPNTNEELIVENLPLGDCDLLFNVARGDVIALPCHGVDDARINVSLSGCSWMEPP